MRCTSEGHYYDLPSANMVEGVGRSELGASSHVDPWQSTGCSRANPDLRERGDGLSSGNLSGLVTSFSFSAPLCSVAWFSCNWAPPFKLADSVIDCLLHSRDVEPTPLLKPVTVTFP